LKNYQRLLDATAQAQAEMLSAPIIGDVASGAIDLDMYRAFLTNAYHHVRYTVPLMMAAAARLHPSNRALLGALKDYVDEEIGHDLWILRDLEACGVDSAEVEGSRPNFETEVMVAYVRDYIEHVDPLGFFGMVHVLEGTSTSLATATADLVQQKLDLPDEAFSYLRSHGELDVEHVAFFQALLEDLDADAMTHVIHVAERVYRLYGDVLRSVPRLEAEASQDAA